MSNQGVIELSETVNYVRTVSLDKRLIGHVARLKNGQWLYAGMQGEVGSFTLQRSAIAKLRELDQEVKDGEVPKASTGC